MTRAHLFDITFLMLCHIAQNYGVEMITDNAETKEISSSFFVTWCAQCLPDGSRYRCPDAALASCDPNRVDALLNQFTSAESEFKTSLVKWNEVCQNSIGAIKEVLLAWEHGAISTENVKVILDNIKSKMCCLPVVISAWLCSYINVLHHDERLKPMNMMQQFMTPLPSSETNSTSGSDDAGASYKERSTLMSTIIKKMLYDLHPPQQSKPKVGTIAHGLTSKTPLGELLETTFAAAHSKTWLDLKGVHIMDTMLAVGGPDWFVDGLVKQLLKYDHSGELDTAVGLVYGLFHLDMEQCAMSLLSRVMPSYLLRDNKQEQLFEPKASALARLVAMSIFTALNSVKHKDKTSRYGRRSHYRVDSNDSTGEPMDVDESSPRGLHGSADLRARFDDTPYASVRKSSTGDNKPSLHSLEPFVKAAASFLLLISTIIADSSVSQRTVFPVVLIEQLILCAKDDAAEVLQFLPHDTIMSLIKITPDNLSHEFLLAIADMNAAKSRKVVAKALCQLKRAQRLNHVSDRCLT